MTTKSVISSLRMRVSSPDFDTLARGPIHAVPRLQPERVVKSVDVASRPIRTELARAVRIGHEPLEQFLVTILAAPDLRPADEESLVSREAVDDRRRLASERHLPGPVRHREARQVADVLAERQLAVDVAIVEHRVAIELRGERVGALLELRGVVRRPPVAQVAVAVELPAAVIEAVADLVADDRANAAVVDGVVGGHVEERRTQDGRGE